MTRRTALLTGVGANRGSSSALIDKNWASKTSNKKVYQHLLTPYGKFRQLRIVYTSFPEINALKLAVKGARTRAGNPSRLGWEAKYRRGKF
jgi:hypothetical protein